MWEPRDPRTSRSVAGARLAHLDIGTSRLSHWPPPHRDSDEKPPAVVAKQQIPEPAPAKPPVRRGWHLKTPVT